MPGRSLLGAIRGEPYDGKARCLYARNSAFHRLEEAVVHDGLKYVRYREPGPAQSLFDLAADPRETKPLRRDLAGVERCLTEAAAPGDVHFEARFEPPDPELLEKLKGLGYGGEDDEPAGAEMKKPEEKKPRVGAEKGDK